MKRLAFAAAIAGLSVPAMAQDDAVAPSAPLVAAQAPRLDAGTSLLPANTEVLLSLNDELTTKGNWMEEGHTFGLSVVHDVTLGDYVVIPAGSRASGTVTWMTDKGMFGKSGKFEIQVNYVEVGNRRVPLEGTFRQEGEGNTVATVGAVIMAPVAGFFVAGKSGRMPKGMEMTVFTAEDMPVRLEAAQPAAAGVGAAQTNLALPVDRTS